MDKAPTQAKSASRSNVPSRPKSTRLPRTFWLFAASTVFVVATITALKQESKPIIMNREETDRTQFLQWWEYPLEFNSTKRLPEFTPNLNAIAVDPTTNRVWVGGDGGMLAYSDIGGSSWTKVELPALAASPEHTVAGVHESFSWLPVVYAAPPENAAQSSLAQKPTSSAQKPTNARRSMPPANAPDQSQNPAQQSSNAKSDAGSKADNSQPAAKDQNQKSDPNQADNTSQQTTNPASQPYQGPVDRAGRPVQANDAKSASSEAQSVPLSTSNASVVNPVPPKGGQKKSTPSPRRPADRVPDAVASPKNGSSEPPDILAIDFSSDRRDGRLATSDGSLFILDKDGKSWRHLPAQVAGVIGEMLEYGGKHLAYKNASLASPGLVFQEAFEWVNRQTIALRSRRAGGIEISADGSTSWKEVVAPGVGVFHSICLSDRNHGWAVGKSGALYSSIDGGQTWTALKSGTTKTLNSVNFLNDGLQGWTVGDDGVIARTRDGGQTWAALSLGAIGNPPKMNGEYWRWLAPWYYLSLVLAGALLTPAMRKPDPTEPPEETIADVLVSDRPLEPGDPDALDLTSIALGLSRFFRNEKTLPPLTIAINGAWGTGKSSLMNLLKADLCSYGFRPVWFNAWHHQKEEQLLAALLQTVRLQAVPHWWNMGGIRFRLRLLWYHWYRYWPPVLLIMLFVALFTGLEYRHNHGVPSALGDLSKPLTIDFWIGQLSTAKTDAPRVGLLLSLLTGLTVLWKGLTAFGVNPASLLTTISQGNKIKDLDAQTSFRQKFAVEFKDVTRALGERSMLVFIDDLDRCRPENVRDLLEAVNFMVSSGECFVVMGMARETVEHCVGLSFKDVAEEMVDDPHVSSGPPYDALDAAKRKRTEFARQYLDKLVNIEVPLPSPNNDQSRKLFIPDQPPQERAVQRRLRRTMAIAKRVVPVVMAMLLIAGGFELGLYLESSSPQAAVNQQFNIPSQPGGTTGAPMPPPGPVNVATPKIAELKVPNDPRPELWVMAWPVYFMLATMLAAFYWALTRKPDLVVKDSVVFTKALEIWYPLVVARQRTPRSVKRFMNRLRYLAMRQRTTRAGYPLWKTFVFRNSLLARLAKWLRVPEPTPVSNPETPMPESILVAVAAIDQLEPEWISDEDAFRAVAVGNVPAREEVAGTGQLMRDAIKKHDEQFSNWSNVATYRRKFLDLCANVTVR